MMSHRSSFIVVPSLPQSPPRLPQLGGGHPFRVLAFPRGPLSTKHECRPTAATELLRPGL
jgi:hypothetical protein